MSKRCQKKPLIAGQVDCYPLLEAGHVISSGTIVIIIINSIHTVFGSAVEPQFNEVLDITNDILCAGQSYSKMYGIEPRYNEFFDIMNIILKPERRIYLDITNYNVNTRQKINAELINSQQIL